jgi:hypothetical protein
MAFEKKIQQQADYFLQDALKSKGIGDDYIAGCRAAVAENDEIIAAREKIIKFATEHIGISAIHPNLDPHEWPPPYGQKVYQALNNSLKQKLQEIAVDETKLMDDYESLINLVQIHKCMKNYCLKPKHQKKKNDTPASTKGC